jgi:integrase
LEGDVATIKLTEKAVQLLRAPTASGRQELFWDETQAGFGVLCSGVSDTKTYIAQTVIHNTRLKRRVTIGRCDRLKVTEARVKAKAVMAKMALGDDPKKAKALSLKQALEAYLDGNSSLRPSSVEGYRRSCERYLGDWLDKPLGDITREMTEKKHAEIAAEIEQRGRYKGHATANATFRAFRAIRNWAAERDADLPPNPVATLRRRWFKVKRRTRLVKADQLAEFYAAIGGLENEIAADYVRFLLLTGMRRTEAATLRWDAVDFVARTILISSEDNKSDEDFKLPMSDLVFNLLVARRAVGRAEYVFVANSESGHIEDPSPHCRLRHRRAGERKRYRTFPDYHSIAVGSPRCFPP